MQDPTVSKPSYRDSIAHMLSTSGLPALVVGTVAREFEQRIGLLRRLFDIATDVDDTDSLPDLFRGAHGKELLTGLLVFSVHYGGQRVYVPHALADEHPFTKTAGRLAASHIAATFGGLPLIVPTVDALYRVVRNRAICEAYAAGKTLNEIVREFDVAYPWVIEILNKRGEPRPAVLEPENQPRLFGF